MSTSYYLACDHHRQAVLCAERDYDMGDPKVTACFVMSHQHCTLCVVPEQEVGDRAFGDKYDDWRSAKVDWDLRWDLPPK